MTVNDLSIGTECTILTKKRDKKYEGVTKILKKNKNYILTDVIRVKGQIVLFNSGLSFLVVNGKTGVPQAFEYIHPIIVRDMNGKSMYKIELKNSSSKDYNRRRKPRMKVGKDIHVKADNTEKAYACKLKDISANGFALVFTGNSIPSNIKSIKSFQFTFADSDPRLAIKVNFALSGEVRRLACINGNQILVGCQIKDSYDLEQYINKKMR